MQQEGGYRPRPLEAPANDLGGGNTYDGLKALVGRKELTFENPVKAYDMLLDLSAEAGMHDDMPENVVMTLHNVALAYGFLVYDQLHDTKQCGFLFRLQSQRDYFQTDQLELTQEEADTLQQIARSVHIDYDPGTETTPEQRIFPFRRVEQHPPQDLSLYTQMTGRAKPPEYDPLIVDSTEPFTSSDNE